MKGAPSGPVSTESLHAPRIGSNALLGRFLLFDLKKIFRNNVDERKKMFQRIPIEGTKPTNQK